MLSLYQTLCIRLFFTINIHLVPEDFNVFFSKCYSSYFVFFQFAALSAHKKYCSWGSNAYLWSFLSFGTQQKCSLFKCMKRHKLVRKFSPQSSLPCLLTTNRLKLTDLLRYHCGDHLKPSSQRYIIVLKMVFSSILFVLVPSLFQ